MVSIVRLLPLLTPVGTKGISAHCPSVHLSARCNLEPEITKKKNYSNLLHETWYVIKWQYANYERYFSPLQEHCVYYGNRNSQIVAKTNLFQIKASLMKLGMWTGAGYARHF